MRDYFYYENLFVECIDSSLKKTLLLTLDSHRHLFIITGNIDLYYLALKKSPTFVSKNLSIGDIVKSFEDELDSFEKLNNIFFGILDTEREFFYFINYNIEYLFLKTNQNIEVIFSKNEIYKRRINLDDLDSIFVVDNIKIGKFFNTEYKSLFFVKELMNELTQEFDKEEFSFIYLNNELNKKSSSSYSYKIQAKKREIEEIEDKVDKLFESRHMLAEEISNIMIIFNELILNAYEHGALKIGGEKKQRLIETNKLDEYKKEQEELIDSNINLSITFFNEQILKISIEDNGDGFEYNKNVNALDSDFRGRGLLMSKSLSNALFFTKDGRKVLFFIRLINQSKIQHKHLEDPFFYSKNMKILYVEDDKFILNTLTRVLKKYTNNLITAQNGEDGLNSFKSLSPDIVISDIEMPKMDGLEMIRQIRILNQDISIILTTAYNESEILLQAINIGVDKFLVKPIKIDSLESVILKISKDIYLKKEAQKMLQKEQELKDEELQSLRLKDESISSAQRIASEKERLIILDERTLIKYLYVDLCYFPLEILSGDIYGISKLTQTQTLYYIIDSMGKGLGASVTATLSAAFINRSISLSLKKDNFIFKKLILDYIDYIKSYLLDYEAVSFIFLMVDLETNSVNYGSFGMYPILFKQKSKITKIKANNPPLLKYLSNYRVSSFKFTGEFDLFMFSDGIIESEYLSLSELVDRFERIDDFRELKADIRDMNIENKFDDDITGIFVSNRAFYKK